MYVSNMIPIDTCFPLDSNGICMNNTVTYTKQRVE